MEILPKIFYSLFWIIVLDYPSFRSFFLSSNRTVQEVKAVISDYSFDHFHTVWLIYYQPSFCQRKKWRLQILFCLNRIHSINYLDIKCILNLRLCSTKAPNILKHIIDHAKFKSERLKNCCYRAFLWQHSVSSDLLKSKYFGMVVWSLDSQSFNSPVFHHENLTCASQIIITQYNIQDKKVGGVLKVLDLASWNL